MSFWPSFYFGAAVFFMLASRRSSDRGDDGWALFAAVMASLEIFLACRSL